MIKKLLAMLMGGVCTVWRPTGEVRVNRFRKRMEQRWVRERTPLWRVEPVVDERWRPHGQDRRAQRAWYERAMASERACRSAQSLETPPELPAEGPSNGDTP